MKGSISNTQMPINQSSLLSLSFFVSYCQDNGLNINNDLLEELHKQKLVYPTLKVFLGIIEYKKIYTVVNEKTDWYYIHPQELHKFKVIKTDKNRYYGIGSLSIHDNWLNYYFDNKMTSFPSQSKFYPWEQKSYYGFYTNTKLINKQYQFVYDKKQLLAIKIALPFLNIIKKHGTHNQELTKALQNKIANLYKFFALYHDAEDLYASFKKKKQEVYLVCKKEAGQKPSKKDLGIEYDIEVFPKFAKQAAKIINKHSVNIEFIYDWREFLSGKSLINESLRCNKIRRSYIKSLNDDTIINLEDIHYMIHVTNFFLYLLTKKEETVKQVLGGFNNKICIICESEFKPRGTKQITCGKAECKQMYKNQIKIKNRKISKISQN